MFDKIYEFRAVIEPVHDHHGAFVRFPYDIRKDIRKQTGKSVGCILRSLADSDAFQSGRYAEHNGRSKTLDFIV